MRCAWRSTEVQERAVQVEDGGFRQFKVLHGGNERASNTSRRKACSSTMCRLRSGAPSSHHTGPRSPSARLTSSTALRAAASASRSAACLGAAYRPSGRHQPANEIGSLGLIETGVCHAPQPAADDEVATVRRHRMLHDTLGRLPLRLGCRLLRCGLLRRLLAGDRHQHFLLTAGGLAWLLGRR